jgi:GDP-L-fucose synthase
MSDLNLPYLRSKRILITGGTGFLGKHLTKRLQSASPTALWSTGRKDLNLLVRREIDEAFDRFQPDVVFHLAATVGGIGANRSEPGRFLYENLQMGIDLLESARIYQTEKVVLVGTVCAYPKFTPVPFREEDLWSGYPEETNAPYGLAKKMLLVQAQAYRAQYGTNAIYLLPANLYGPGDHFDLQNSHVIPSLIHKFHLAVKEQREDVELWGTGGATREFLNVLDAARGISLAAELYNDGEPVNIGTGMEISIREVAELIARESKFFGEIRWNKNMPDGQPRRCLNVDRARDRFGFNAEVEFETGIREMIASLVPQIEQSYSESRRLKSPSVICEGRTELTT